MLLNLLFFASAMIAKEFALHLLHGLVLDAGCVCHLEFSALINLHFQINLLE